MVPAAIHPSHAKEKQPTTTTNSQPQALPPLRAVYADLGGTPLGEGGSILRDACGGFSLCQAQALQACFAAGVEVIPMTGRHRAQAEADARILGLASVIYELGCAFKIDGERYELTGHWRTDADDTPAESSAGFESPAWRDPGERPGHRWRGPRGPRPI